MVKALWEPIPYSAEDRRALVLLPEQKFFLLEGNKVVMSGHVSTGADWGWRTWTRYQPVYHVLYKDPAGAKSRSIIPGEYNVATPWKFVISNAPRLRWHEYHYVPRHPASHGCTRERLGKGKAVYEFVDPGMPIYYRLLKTLRQALSPSPEGQLKAASAKADKLTLAVQQPETLDDDGRIIPTK